MLMVTAGWPATPGTAGESTIVRWSDTLHQMREASPATYDADRALLSETPIIITALPAMAMDPQLRDQYAAATTRFAEAANHPAARYTHPMRPGQIILLDNNRFGHGRLPFPQTRPTDYGTATNPRTLWSTVLA